MSLIPRLLGYHPWDYLRPARRMLDWDHFGMSPAELSALMEFPQLSVSPRMTSEELEQSTIGKDGFQVSINVQQFKPSEISVKTVDNAVVVEGKHEERSDEHGLISRHFIRQFILPKGYDHKEVISTLSSDGILTVKAPLPKEAIENKNERVVQIQQTGPAHLNVKENPAVESKEKK